MNVHKANVILQRKKAPVPNALSIQLLYAAAQAHEKAEPLPDSRIYLDPRSRGKQQATNCKQCMT